MKKSRFTENQIVSILKEADAGKKVTEISRERFAGDRRNYRGNISSKLLELITVS